MNETAIKILCGVVLTVMLGLGVAWFRSHYIEVGVKQEQDRVALVATQEAARQAEAKANALNDAASRVAALRDSEKALSGALNSSEVLNHAETDSPCLSDSRRLRIDAIR